jgi:hypothetical protein
VWDRYITPGKFTVKRKTTRVGRSSGKLRWNWITNAGMIVIKTKRITMKRVRDFEPVVRESSKIKVHGRATFDTEYYVPDGSQCNRTSPDFFGAG